MAKNLRTTDTVTVALSGTDSTSLSLSDNRIPLALVLPATFDGSTITFKASIDGSTFYVLRDEGTDYSVTVTASRYVALKRSVFETVKYLQLICGTTQTTTTTVITVISGD